MQPEGACVAISVLLGRSIACTFVIGDLLIGARSVRTSKRAHRCTFSQFFARVRSPCPSATSPTLRPTERCSMLRALWSSGALQRWQVGAPHMSILAPLPKSVGHLQRTDLEVWSVGHRPDPRDQPLHPCVPRLLAHGVCVKLCSRCRGHARANASKSAATCGSCQAKNVVKGGRLCGPDNRRSYSASSIEPTRNAKHRVPLQGWFRAGCTTKCSN